MSKNSTILAWFAEYCRRHPSERLWQALRNWAGVDFVLIAKHDPKFGQLGHDTPWDVETIRDTFYDDDTKRELGMEVGIENGIL